MSDLVKIPCHRCDGRGRLSGYSHVQGGLCFACGGSGGKTITAKQAKAAAARKAKADEKRKVQRAAERTRQEAASAEWDRVIERYRNDPRLGPRTRARYDEFPQVAFQTAQLLRKIDTVPGFADGKPWLLSNISE